MDPIDGLASFQLTPPALKTPTGERILRSPANDHQHISTVATAYRRLPKRFRAKNPNTSEAIKIPRGIAIVMSAAEL